MPVALGAMFRGRLGFILALVAFVLGIVLLYARERFVDVLTLIMTDGLLVVGWLAAAGLLGHALVGR
ncbi:MAG: hypothetical protein ACAI43_25655, partial [Phycisphaerae bacterium]